MSPPPLLSGATHLTQDPLFPRANRLAPPSQRSRFMHLATVFACCGSTYLAPPFPFSGSPVCLHPFHALEPPTWPWHLCSLEPSTWPHHLYALWNHQPDPVPSVLRSHPFSPVLSIFWIYSLCLAIFMLWSHIPGVILSALWIHPLGLNPFNITMARPLNPNCQFVIVWFNSVIVNIVSE